MSWLRVVLQLVVAIDAALIAYLAQPATSRPVWVLATIALGCGMVVVAYVIVTVYSLLRTLENNDVP